MKLPLVLDEASRITPAGWAIRPFGDKTFDDLLFFYQTQIGKLVDKKVSYLYIESASSMPDLRAATIEALKTGLPVFVTVKVDETSRTKSGMTALCALILLQEMGISAFGIDSPDFDILQEQIKLLVKYSKIPVIAKLSGIFASDELDDRCEKLILAGAKVIGDNLDSEQLNVLKQIVSKYEDIVLLPPEEVVAATSDTDVYFLDTDNLLFSEPLGCGFSLEDDLIGIEDDRANVILIRADTLEDAINLCESAHMARLPIAVSTDSSDVLGICLKNFQGRIIVNSQVEINPVTIKMIAEKYGAIIY